MEPTVALCMIVRNEQVALPRCLDSVATAVDAIYITDTGSQDETVAIAQRYGATIRHFTWCDDFSAARNHSIQDIQEDWLLLLDADDYFPTGEATRLRSYLKNSAALALTLEYEVTTGYTPAPTRRLIRNHRGLRFSGIIHESIRASLPQNDEQHTQSTDIRLQHLGYNPESLPAKLNRNLPLLQKEWERCQSGTDTCQRLLIGKELAATLIQLKRPAEGELLLASMLTEWSGKPNEAAFALEAMITLLWHYQATARASAAWQLCERMKASLQSEPAYSLYHGLAAFQTQNFAAAWESLTAFEAHWLAGHIHVPVPICYTGLALWDLQGQCCLQMGRATEAARLFDKCLAAGGENKEYATKLHLARQLAST